ETLVDLARKWDPRNVQAQVFKSQLLAQRGERAEAIALLKTVTANDRDAALAQFVLGRLYASTGDAPAAEQAYLEVLRVNPRATAAQVELSKIQRSTGKAAAAVQSAEAAMKNLPKNPQVRLALVRSLLAANDLQRAEVEISKLLADYPDLAAAHVQGGALAFARNDSSGARAKFDKAIALDP